MTRTLPAPSSRLRSIAVSAVAATLLLGVTVAGCAAGTSGSTAPPASGSSTAVASPAGQRIVLRFDDEAVLATLSDTAAARQFAAQLPLTLDLRDPMGQAKSGPLPGPIDTASAETDVDPDAGGIYYVPDRAMIAIFYDDLGQTVPPPGLVQLGTVDSGADTIDAAGNRMRVLMDLADRTSS